MEIYVLRHCKTESNINNKWCGSKSDINLSSIGEQQNNKVINELSKIDLYVIYGDPCPKSSALLPVKPL